MGEPMIEAPKDPIDIGQAAYEAYCGHVGWLSMSGEQLPRFSTQAPKTRNAWRLAAEAAVRAALAPRRGDPAEELHAEHHPGIFVPSLDSCPEHTREEYEQLARSVGR